jgi:hypothetical protein
MKQRIREIAAMVECYQQSDNSDEDAEKTAVIAELLAAVVASDASEPAKLSECALLAVLPRDISWETIPNLTAEELTLFCDARPEDLERKLERIRRRAAVELEVMDLARSVTEKYPELLLRKVEYFLHGEVRTRFEQLRHDLGEMSSVLLVTRDRQPWHQAVEREIYTEMKRGTDIGSVVTAVMRRDSTYPRDRVRAYAEYILETAAGLR